jgi:hypothetical protein
LKENRLYSERSTTNECPDAVEALWCNWLLIIAIVAILLTSVCEDTVIGGDWLMWNKRVSLRFFWLRNCAAAKWQDIMILSCILLETGQERQGIFRVLGGGLVKVIVILSWKLYCKKVLCLCYCEWVFWSLLSTPVYSIHNSKFYFRPCCKQVLGIVNAWLQQGEQWSLPLYPIHVGLVSLEICWNGHEMVQDLWFLLGGTLVLERALFFYRFFLKCNSLDCFLMCIVCMQNVESSESLVLTFFVHFNGINRQWKWHICNSFNP